MSALAKWLAKHAHVLSEPQKVAAKAYTEALHAHDAHKATRYLLQEMQPHEAKAISWLYGPEYGSTLNREVDAYKDLKSAFGKHENHYDPEDLTDELGMGLSKDSFERYKDVEPSRDRFSSLYRKRE